ncbi:MAG: SRPBCC domain-containing protein [Candidatus Micrarchaeaceae archaeon]
MELSGKAEINAPQASIYNLLTTPSKMAGLIPGVESFSEAPDGVNMDVSIGLSFIKGKFKVKMKPVSMRSPSHAELKGSASGAGSSIDFLAKFDIKEIDAKRSEVSWNAQVNVGGAVATFGNSMIKTAADKLVAQIIESLKKAKY